MELPWLLTPSFFLLLNGVEFCLSDNGENLQNVVLMLTIIDPLGGRFLICESSYIAFLYLRYLSISFSVRFDPANLLMFFGILFLKMQHLLL